MAQSPSEGIRLPPISFISGQSGTKLPAPSLGISSFLNAPSPLPEEQDNKRIKLDTEIPSKESPAETEEPKQAAVIEPVVAEPEVEKVTEVAKVERVKIPTVPIVLDTAPINEVIAEYFPVRHNLGTIVYNPTTTWTTLQTSQLYGLKSDLYDRFEEIKEQYAARLQDNPDIETRYIPSIPPLTQEYINSIIEVKIPYRHVSEHLVNMDNVVRRRELWGGASGVYTDDSDILSVLTHLGLFENKADLKTWNPQWETKDLIRPLGGDDEDEVYGDLSVEVLLLPPLPQYHGYYAHGINSRTWAELNHHSGLSIAIHNIKWESCGAYLRDASIFRRYQTEMMRDKQESFKQKGGWKFDHKYYKELKGKFEEEAKKDHKEDEKEDKAVQEQPATTDEPVVEK